MRLRCLPRLTDNDLKSLDTLQSRFETWLRDDYHLRRHGGIGLKPLDRFLAGAETTLIQRLAPPELDHAFMGRLVRLVRLVRNDATVKLGGQFYRSPRGPERRRRPTSTLACWES